MYIIYIYHHRLQLEAIELAEVVSKFSSPGKAKKKKKNNPFWTIFSLFWKQKAKSFLTWLAKTVYFNTNTKPSMSFSISFEENG